MTLPAEEPGTWHEPPGNRRPRGMITLDRIRLTGLLQRTPAKRGGSLFTGPSLAVRHEEGEDPNRRVADGVQALRIDRHGGR
jgi:hypothetical protein